MTDADCGDDLALHANTPYPSQTSVAQPRASCK